VVYRRHLTLTKEWSCMLRVNCILDMRKFVRFSKNSGKREMIIEELETVKVSDALAPDLYLLPPRLAVLKLPLKSKKSSMMASTIVLKP